MPWCRSDFSDAEASSWIRQKLADWRARREFNFAIVGDGRRFLGTCSLNQFHGYYPFANIGYWVRTSATGRGVATAAVRQIVDFAKRETELLRLEVVVAVGNAASARVAEKVGAHLEGRLRSRLVLHGVPHDADLYSIVLTGEHHSEGRASDFD
jgi:RimJ/RimL family protein N-acetyltransferase